MMVFAAILEFCGFFEYVAIKATKLSKGDPWMLVVYLGTFTTVISLLIDNVTAIIIIAPVTLRMCNKLEINPIPPLIAEAILSDTGGVASMVGDPPNVMIASKAADMGLTTFGFNDFLAHLGILTIALSGAGILLTLVRPHEEELRQGFVNDIVDKIEWQALLFFAGLFILVGAIGEIGYLTSVANLVYNIAGDNPLYLAITVIWVAAIASALIDNIPFTAAMIPVIISLQVQYDVNPEPLFWALAMGAGFGGNATPIGSSANVMTVAISERGPNPITTKEWARVGLPIMIITCVFATIFMAVFYNILYA
jgi:Na+/H+ antiporter NhaD/arsenite permease-like protein